MKEDREFFGVTDDRGTTLQAMYNSELDEYWFEVPRPDLGGSYGASLGWDAATDLLKAVQAPIPLEGFDGFEFQSWE